MSQDRLDKILEQLTEIRVVQARHEVLHEKNTEDLAEHMRRTSVNEERLDMHQEELMTIKQSGITKKDIYTALGIMGSAIGVIFTVLEKLKLI